MDKIKDFECFPIEANKQAGNLQQFSNIFGQSVSSKNDILNIRRGEQIYYWLIADSMKLPKKQLVMLLVTRKITFYAAVHIEKLYTL